MVLLTVMNHQEVVVKKPLMYFYLKFEIGFPSLKKNLVEFPTLFLAFIISTTTKVAKLKVASRIIMALKGKFNGYPIYL